MQLVKQIAFGVVVASMIAIVVAMYYGIGVEYWGELTK